MSFFTIGSLGFILLTLAFVFVTLYRRSRPNFGMSLGKQNAAYEQGLLTVNKVSDRPIAPDGNGDAFMTISGYADGPSVQNLLVYNSFVVKFNILWPEPGQQIPIIYLPNKIQQSWQILS